MPLPTDPALPLADLKILDFSWVGVAPITVKYLADHGATVIRVESHARLDVVRLGPPWHDGKPGIERSQFYASYNTSKYGIALDLSRPEARAIARRLAVWADVVVESFTPHVMRGWGLGWDDLRALNARLVMMSTCLQGQTGPHAEYPGFGQLMAALSGFYEISGWPDRAPAPPYGAYTDFIVPRLAATALLAAIDHQRRTGEGQYLDVSQFEASLHFLAPALLQHSLDGTVARRDGNASDHAAPSSLRAWRFRQRRSPGAPMHSGLKPRPRPLPGRSRTRASSCRSSAWAPRSPFRPPARRSAARSRA